MTEYQSEIQRLRAKLDRDWHDSAYSRELANEDYRFGNVTGGQWEGWLEDTYENRAKPEINVVSRFARRVKAQWANNRQAVNYSPANESTGEDLSELLDGMLRRDVQASSGQAAIDLAVYEDIDCGFGAVTLKTAYEDEGDPENLRQNIEFCATPCAYSTVVFDASARRADKKDARWVNVLTSHGEEDFKRLWPDFEPDSIDLPETTWFDQRGANLVYVSTLYEVEEVRVKVHVFTNPATQETAYVDEPDLEDALPEMELGGFVPLTRIGEGSPLLREAKTVKRRQVFKTVFSATGVLERKRRIVGEWLPVIPFYGDRSWVDGVEQYRGVIRELVDLQRMLNMIFGLTAESASNASDSKPILHPDQVKNASVRNSWARDNHQNAYRLLGEIKGEEGQPNFYGPVGQTPGAQISPALGTLAAMVSEAFQAGTGGEPQDIADPNASGKAINAIIKRVDMNTQIFFDNIDMSIIHMGVVYASMAGELYSGRENVGRVVRPVDDKGKSKPVQLLELTGRNGRLERANNIGSGKYGVVVGVQRDYQTEKEETFEGLKDMILGMQPGDPIRMAGEKVLLLMKEIPGADEFKAYIRNQLIVEGIYSPETPEEIQMMQNLQNQPNPNQELIDAQTQELLEQARLNQASTADKAASAVQRAAVAKKTNLESAQIAQELQHPLARVAQ